jgi:glycerol-3-phosphate dehydrogenase
MNSEIFEREVRMWMYEEKIEGRNLTEIVNTEHENVKYLPGVKLPVNVVWRSFIYYFIAFFPPLSVFPFTITNVT